MPDLFVAMDTSSNYRYFNNIIRKNVLYPYVIGYIDQNRDKLLKQYPAFDQFKKGFELADESMNELIALGDKDGIEKDEEGLKVSGKLIRRQIKALIARDLYEPSDFYRIMLDDDNEIIKALEILEDQSTYNAILGRKN